MMSGVEATTTGPRSSASEAVWASASMPSTSGVATSASVLPTDVSWMGRLNLSNNVAPSSASSFLMCVVTVGCPMPRISAALEMLRTLAAVQKLRNSLSSMPAASIIT